jgi:2-polyprenyl-3-methyl-5-hydroxy-6-metoxy-1,4-benzoquinol methylase
MQEFAEARKRFKREMRALLAQREKRSFQEAAFPAYAHRNPLIEYLFWKRLRVAYDFCLNRSGPRVLDFGCGPGMLVYLLARRGFQVTALDLDLSPLKALSRRIPFPEDVRLLEMELLSSPLGASSFDTILAIDVLEHIHDLKPYLDRFSLLLAPGGTILVSAPTENWLYRIGRKMAGRRFSGDYHESGAAEVRDAFESGFVIERVATLVRPVPLFELFSARPRSQRP